ncbi:hypothetical protein ABE426_19120 [Sphingobacterium faecium]|uniref:hypothetical protein n=1 Tax=Sphingobacterium faecium TaxID=34087 RepID=UPI00320A63C7
MISRRFLQQQSYTFTSKQKCTIIEFFITFSRFEFALIASGKVKGRNYAMADWTTFANEIQQQYDETVKNEESQVAVNYILGNPPSFLANDVGHVQWKIKNFEEGTLEIIKLCEFIKSIRNNLFHGSKFTFQAHNNRERDFKLVESALIILNHLLSLDEVIKERFLEPIG